jgi:hypothetical protein
MGRRVRSPSGPSALVALDLRPHCKLVASLTFSQVYKICEKVRLTIRVSVSASRCLQDSESKSLSSCSGRVGKERPIDRGQRHLGAVLSQQHLAGARANGAVFRKPGQTKGAKKLSALGISFKRRQRDMKQRVIREEN